jgi:hypothetical protein
MWETTKCFPNFYKRFNCPNLNPQMVLVLKEIEKDLVVIREKSPGGVVQKLR